MTNTTANVAFVGESDGPSSSIINVHGHSIVNLSGLGISTITLDPGAQLNGNEALTRSTITITGGVGSAYRPGTVLLAFAVGETVGVPTIGGAFTVGTYSRLTFDNSVGARTTVATSSYSTLKIDQAKTFKGAITWAPNDFGETVNIAGLKADGYSYASGLLSLFSQGHLVDALKVANLTGSFSIVQTASGVEITGPAIDQPAAATPLYDYGASVISINNALAPKPMLYLSAATPFHGTVDLGGYPSSLPLLDVTNTRATVDLRYGEAGTINIHGRSSLNLSSAFVTTINLDPNAKLSGNFDATRGTVIINGGVFTPGSVTAGMSSFAINSNTIGGVFNNSGAGSFYFGKSASSSTVINMGHGGGLTGLTIGDPQAFKAVVNIVDYFAPIQINGLVADSYSYKNDVLSFFEHGMKIDTLKMNDTGPAGFNVTENAGGTIISAAVGMATSMSGTHIPILHA